LAGGSPCPAPKELREATAALDLNSKSFLLLPVNDSEAAGGGSHW